ncbi:MAG: hypothetical protein R2860_11495 [Desulfobacterales bacterium]
MVGRPVTLPDITLTETADRIEDVTSVTIEAPDLCPGTRPGW